MKEMIDRVRNFEKVPIVIVGNKKDLEHKRQVSTKEGQLLANEFNCPFFETSAAVRHNVDEMFVEVIRCIRWKEKDDYLASTKGQGGGGKGQRERSVLDFLCCMGKGESS